MTQHGPNIKPKMILQKINHFFVVYTHGTHEGSIWQEDKSTAW